PAARRRLIALIVLLPVMVVAGGLLGGHLAVPLSRLDPSIELAERIRAEQLGLVQDTTDASDAFRNTQRPVEELYAAADRQRVKLAWAGLALGIWVGLVVGLKLISLARYPQRLDYDPNPSNCVSCARCFWYCPRDEANHERHEKHEIKKP
ncbi:MAG TPA: 4Fe-4S ferredoxin, partial [Thermoguttaceae bacterium]|nr:4Fe-4S ferredoxin [Thermoguttaceae bacterium]